MITQLYINSQRLYLTLLKLFSNDSCINRVQHSDQKLAAQSKPCAEDKFYFVIQQEKRRKSGHSQQRGYTYRVFFRLSETNQTEIGNYCLISLICILSLSFAFNILHCSLMSLTFILSYFSTYSIEDAHPLTRISLPSCYAITLSLLLKLNVST